MWMKRSRQWADQELKDVARFATQYRMWWKALQPRERSESNNITLPAPTPTMDWTCLRKPGMNGLLLVAVALRWWGKASHTDADWCAAAQDFYLALQCICKEDGDIVAPIVPVTSAFVIPSLSNPEITTSGPSNPATPHKQLSADEPAQTKKKQRKPAQRRAVPALKPTSKVASKPKSTTKTGVNARTSRANPGLTTRSAAASLANTGVTTRSAVSNKRPAAVYAAASTSKRARTGQ